MITRSAVMKCNYGYWGFGGFDGLMCATYLRRIFDLDGVDRIKMVVSDKRPTDDEAYVELRVKCYYNPREISSLRLKAPDESYARRPYILYSLKEYLVRKKITNPDTLYYTWVEIV